MENKPLNIALIILVGILAGVSALFSINAVIQSSMVPYMSRLSEIAHNQQLILEAVKQKPETVSNNDISMVLNQLASLETKIKNLEVRPAPTPTPQGPPPEDYNTVHEIPLDDSYIYGDKNAPVTIVGFKDFQCPFCARFHTPVMEAVAKNKGKVNYIIKNYPLPFHGNAQSAAKAALAAGEQGKYYEMADKLLDNFQNLGDAQYEQFAKEIGLNVKKFKDDLVKNDAKYAAIIQKDLELGSKVGVRGTPTYYINGKKTQARTADQYQQEIDAILK